MNNLNSTDDIVECPLCMEPLEVDDLNFYPCTCGYQICRFCWHRIRTDENQLCPACRKEYPENPADFKPLSQEEMVAFKFQKRQRDQKRKQEITENRKHLANVRVVQKNLVFVVGLPPRLADAEILKKHEYFGKYGKIHKVVINPSTAYAGVQGPSASAYVTYVHNPDALRAIQSVNNIMIDGRLIKTSLGTTKYCSHFMKNQQCPKSDCMYLHELGDPEASFTKEEMHQGKHQDYEKRLHDVLIATSGSSTVAGGGLVTTTTSTGGGSSALITSSSSSKVLDSGKSSGGGLVTSNSSKAIAAQSHDARDIGTSHTNSSAVAVAAVNGQQTEAWPSLSVSPVNKKDSLTNNNVGKSKKERQKQEKAKAAEKNGKTKNKNQNNGNSNNHHSNHTLAKDGNETMASKLASLNTDSNSSGGSSSSIPTNITDKAQRNQETKERNSKQQSNNQSNNCQSQPQRKESDYNPAAATEPETLKKSGGGGGGAGGGGSSSNSHHQTKSSTEILSKSSQEATQTQRETARQSQANKETNLSNKTEENPQNQLYVSNSNISNSSISSSSSSSSSSTSSNSNHESNLANDTTTNTTTNLTKLRNSPIPQDIQKLSSLEDNTTQIPTNPEKITNVSSSDSCPFTESIERTASLSDNFNGFKSKTPASVRDLLQQNSYNALNMDDNLDKSSMGGHHVKNGNELNVNSTTTTTTEMPKLSLFDDNSFFSLNSAKIPTTQSLQQQQQQQHHNANQLLNSSNKFLDDPLLTGRTIANLPDLINGIDGYQTNINCTNDWEDAFKSVILKTNKQMEEKLQQQQLQQHIHNHHQLKQQEDLRKLQELQKRNILLNSIRASQMQGGGGGPLGGGSTVEQLQRQSHFMPPLHNNPLLQSQLQANAENVLQNPNLSFETNMSKFFDFHKHQQQQKLQHYGGGGPSGLGGGLVDNFHMMSLLENKPLNSQLLDHNSLINTHLQQQQQQQQQKQKLYQKMDPLMHHQQQLQQQQQHPQANQKHPVNVSSLHTPQNHLKNQYMQNSNADDDLGFDPFIETQKALAELIENEEEQMHHTQNTHSSPIAPPGKQPMNQPNQPPPPPPHQDPMLEYMQRLRMPPPGFNHLNSNLGGGYGGGAPMDPRLHTNQNSKILPFMNLPGNNQQHMPPQQHPLQMPNPNVWGTHMQQQQQQQQQQSMTGLRHDNLQTPQTMGNQKSGYSGSDWTAMDPAILSFRQFSFPQQQQQQQMPGGPPQQMPPLPQQQQQQPPQDLFLQHLSQQSVGGGFGLGGGPQLNGPMTNAAAVAAGLLQSQAQQHHSSQTGHVNVDANVQGMLEFLKTQQYV